MNLRPVIAPMLTIERRATTLPSASSVQAVLVTSGQALSTLSTLTTAPLLAVGDATARRARAMDFAVVHSANGDARALAQLTERLCDPSGQPLLLVSGEGQGHALRAMLEQAGFVVMHHAVYAAVPAPTMPEVARKALIQGILRAALFFSAETARVFVRLAKASGLDQNTTNAEAVAIGSETAVALQGVPWRRVRVAAKPTQDEMLALLR